MTTKKPNKSYIVDDTWNRYVDEARLNVECPKNLREYLEEQEKFIKELMPKLPSDVRDDHKFGLERYLGWINSASIRGDDDQVIVYLYRYQRNVDRAISDYHQSIANPFRQRQSEKSKKAHEKRWGDKELRLHIEELISKLAKLEDYGERYKTRDLWPLFYSALDDYGLDPDDTSGEVIKDADRMTWTGDDKGISYKTFENKITKARGK